MNTSEKPEFNNYTIPVTLILTFVVAILFILSLIIGPANIPLTEAFLGIWDENEPVITTILLELRLPRAILGLMVGATLGLSGAALQGLLRNPLAEPGIIGVSSSAALGSVLVYYFGLFSSFSYALPLGGIIGASLAVGFLYMLAGKEPGTLRLILSGIAISSLAAALTSLALNLSPNPYAAYEILLWLMGSLSDRSFDHVWLAGPLMVLGWVFLFLSGRALDALSLGEETTKTLGFSIKQTNLLVIIGTATSVGAAVSVTGGIAFIGLVVPHLLRPLVKHEPRKLLLVSALGGAALLLAADIMIKLLSNQSELKLGVLTSLIGAPFFLWLIIKNKRMDND